MRKVKIITDSVADITLEEAKSLDVDVLPLTVTFDEVEYKDGVDITTDKLFNLMKEHDGFPTTSQVAPYLFSDKMQECLDNEMDIVIITMSSKLSGTYNTANLVKSQFEYENIYVVDSLNVTCGQYVLLKYAIILRDQGKSAKEIYEELEVAKYRIKSSVFLDTLDNLARSGRITKTAGFVGGLLQVKPIIKLIDGIIQPVSKERGIRKAINYILSDLEKENLKEGTKVCLGSCLESENLKYLVEKCEELGLPYEKLEVGPVTASHIGPYAMGYFLLEEYD